MTDTKVKGVYAKLNALHKMVCKCDWTPEGSMKLSGNTIKYISIAQMKANLSPIFADAGLFIIPEMGEPVFNSDARTWVVPLKFTIVDTESGETTTSQFYGSGEGGKGIAIAISYALKMFLSTTFLLADGIDPDKEGIASVVSTFTPKSNKEREEVISKLEEAAVPAEAVSNPMTMATPVKAKEEKKPAEEVAKQPAESNVRHPPYSQLQGKSIARILGNLGETMSPEEFAEVRAEAEAISSSEEARTFINKYKAN